MGRGTLEARPVQQPWLGRGRWALHSSGTQSPPLSQLPIASPLPMVLLLAALSAIKKTGPVVAS